MDPNFDSYNISNLDLSGDLKKRWSLILGYIVLQK